MDIKQCCTDFYQNDLVKMMFGDSMHPGALSLTDELANNLGLSYHDNILDVACGIGTSSIHLAKKIKCKNTGIDLSEKNIKTAKKIAFEQNVSSLTSFKVGDAEKIDFANSEFDAILCECAFCLFPNKKVVSDEFFRILKHGGKIGISDVIVRGDLPDEMKSALYHFICILDAKDETTYSDYLIDAGFSNIQVIDKKNELLKLLDDVKSRIFVAEFAMNMGKLKLDIDIKKIKSILKVIVDAVQNDTLSYAIITGEK